MGKEDHPAPAADMPHIGCSRMTSVSILLLSLRPEVHRSRARVTRSILHGEGSKCHRDTTVNAIQASPSFFDSNIEEVAQLLLRR